MRALQQRLQYVEAQAAAQRPIEEDLSRRYKRDLRGMGESGEHLEMSPIGGSALPVASVEVTQKTLHTLAAQPKVIAVLPNQRVHLIRPKEVDFERLGRQEKKDRITWGLKQLDVPTLWRSTRGKDVNVAVLDTGVYGDHPALAGKVKDFVLIDPLGRRIASEPTFDCASHGTHVCGTIAGSETPDGVAIGVAPEANLLVAAVLLGEPTLRTLIEGLSWAVERGADIVNMSLGFSYYEPLFAQLLTMLVETYDVLPVVAIGNDNHGNCSSPGNAHSAFSVGAVEKLPRNRTGVAAFSSGASLVFPGAEPEALVTKPDVVAPGVQVYSCIPPEKRPHGIYEYTYMAGTSMATPHVAGAAALLMAAKPEATAARVLAALKETAKHPLGGLRRPDNRWGYGMIRPSEALKALG
ncbi:MAG TPA: S8 family serine peptidase [Thermoanaerobaculia bacterium]|nr:S8 family serine peptidase [Thermoanaerobaculia bacterium]